MLGDDDDTSDNRRSHLSHVVLALQRQLDDTHAQLRRLKTLSYQKTSLLDTGRSVLQQHCSATQENRADGATATVEISPTWQGWELRVEIHAPFSLVNIRSRMSIAIVHPQQSVSCSKLACDVAATCETSTMAAAMLRAAVHLPANNNGETSSPSPSLASSLQQQKSNWEEKAHVYVLIIGVDGNASAVYAGEVNLDPQIWLQALAHTRPPPLIAPETTQAFNKGPALEIDISSSDIRLVYSTLEGRMSFTKRAESQVPEKWQLGNIAEAEVILGGGGNSSRVQVVFSACNAGLLPLLRDQLNKGITELAIQKGITTPRIIEEQEVQGRAIIEKEILLQATDALVSELAAMKVWVGALQESHAAHDSVYRVQKQFLPTCASIIAQKAAIEAMMESDRTVAAALSPPAIP